MAHELPHNDDRISSIVGKYHEQGLDLLDQHARLLAGSAVAAEVAEARGYCSVQRPADLQALGFSLAQRNVPGLLIPIFNVAGELITHQYRPDTPRKNKDGKPVKYETPSGSSMVLDVPLRARSGLADPSQPLFITEGARKADAAVSCGLCCVALLGVWNFRGTNSQGGKTALGDWESIALNGRDVHIAFDSDVMSKPSVYGALIRLKALLESRHAHVLLIYLPPGDGGVKIGLDDYLAAGHTVEDLLALATVELRDPGGARQEGRVPSQATRLADLARDAGVALFHTPQLEGFATIPLQGHSETWPLRSKMFKQWLVRCFYERDHATPGAQALQDALGVLEGQALYDGPEYPVFVRLARHDDAIYLDLANAHWQTVELTTAGWRVIIDPPVKFRRPKGMQPLPVPRRAGKIDAFWPFVNVPDTTGLTLLAAFLVATLRPEGPYPILILGGEQGSAKSTLARLIRSLIDPSSTPLRSEPRSEHDLMIAAANSWLLTFDNLSHIPAWLSDALCRLSTGGGFATRELYSDAEETIFDAQRPIVLTSIEDIATRGDLLDRAILLTLAPIADSARRPERELWTAFDADRAHILGSLLDAVACALRRLPETRLDKLPRMADFALWAVAAEHGLGLEHGAFLAAYTGNRHDAVSLALEADGIAAMIVAFMDAQPNKEWTGTASELLDTLSARVSEAERKRDWWPRRGDKLSSRLRRLAPDLRRIGIDVQFGKSHNKGRPIIIRKTAPSSVPSVPSVPSVSSAAESGDATPSDGDATAFTGDANEWQEDASSCKGDARDASLHDDSSGPKGKCSACGAPILADGQCAFCDGNRLEDEYEHVA